MGEPERFRVMYAQHYEAVLRYARRRVGEDSAPDVAADVFTTAWRRMDVVPEDALPWLYGVARNTVASHARGERHAARLAERWEGEGTARDAGNQVAARHLVIGAWASLREADRELLALIGWEGLTVRQAARALGCTAATCSVRLRRALARQEQTDQRGVGSLEGQSWA
ncbi:RNA polymerase sigma factor [Streptomyces litchfieldiae]|uniref:Sigma-70 family RNA polymerase sigma factor n=1 Tax=Streptomyces litchfieldiae TaxID=3075543 RepID=A0ABU2MZH1_9ACTN|nr:sigma-70 family RNA polymerase sigma factor [Streptomyces sp. DSM 44938]MDT0347025.1 sigma-70 family RNA polymerase sigma factor [Streptomyces sp. DSM 44938]